MEAQLSEALTFPVTSYSSSFFSKQPSDERFLQTTFQKFMPSGSIDAQTIEFCLERFDAGNIYLIQNSCVKVQCVILKANGELPDSDKYVGCANNILHSLFEVVRYN